MRNRLGAPPERSDTVAVTSIFVPPEPKPSVLRKARLPWFRRVKRPVISQKFPRGACSGGHGLRRCDVFANLFKKI